VAGHASSDQQNKQAETEQASIEAAKGAGEGTR
jgi:hypothetical protein